MKIPLTQGCYQSRSIISEAQRCVNLFPERNPDDAIFPFTTYPAPGKPELAQAPVVAEVRGLYTASNNSFYAAVGSKFYVVATNWTFTLLGSLATSSGQVRMRDNGDTLVIVDGSDSGYTVDLDTNAFAAISSESWYGSTRVDYLDTFLVFNRPATQQFYISGSVAVTFDPLDVAAKVGAPDLLQACLVVHREIWLVGQKTTEIWYNIGAPDFPFAAMPGVFVEHGTPAPYSIASYDTAIFFLSQDASGRCVIVEGTGYEVSRISTHSIEVAISAYDVISDAFAYTYTQEGHTFYVITFPSADATWVWDLSERLWHQRGKVDIDGTLHRDRSNCCASFNDKIVVGDYQNGKLYALDLDTYQDDGDPMVYIRSFPHITDNGDRVIHKSFIADMEVGNPLAVGATEEQNISLKWSDTRGKSYGNALEQSLGLNGQYLTQPQWSRLGLARDRVYELSWSAPVKTALNGAYLEATKVNS